MNSSTRLPRIGITTYGQNDLNCFYLPRAYVNAIRKAGGLPILFPPGENNLEDILESIDGLLLPGGGDINPALYGGTDHPAIYNVDPERDAFELPLAQLALHRQIPILGICRGLQVLSVVSGAALVAHVPDEFGSLVIHRAERTQPIQHQVDLVPGTRLAALTEQTTLTVNSLHHQAVREVPPGWQVAARAADGLIEAIEHPSHPWAMALQWHPEFSPDHPLQCRIFEAFVAVAQGQEIPPLSQKKSVIAVP